MDYNVLLTEILKAACVAAIPVGSVLIGKGYNWLTAWVEAQTTNEYLRRIEHEAFTIVAAVGQAIAEPAKEALADGKLTDSERQRLKIIAMDALRVRLAGLPAALLADQRLSDAIEAAIPAAKAVAAIPAASVVPPVAPVSR